MKTSVAILIARETYNALPVHLFTQVYRFLKDVSSETLILDLQKGSLFGTFFGPLLDPFLDHFWLDFWGSLGAHSGCEMLHFSRNKPISFKTMLISRGIGLFGASGFRL